MNDSDNEELTNSRLKSNDSLEKVSEDDEKSEIEVDMNMHNSPKLAINLN